jgi:hypothetical protein
MYSNFIVALVAIIAVVTNAAELKNSKTALRTQASKTSAMVYTCVSGGVYQTSGYLLDTCMSWVSGSLKVIATSSTLTTLNYYSSTDCSGSITPNPANVGTECSNDPNNPLYSTQGTDTSLTLPAYSVLLT